MRAGLEHQCDFGEYNDVFACGTNSSFCTIDNNVCDGVADCPNGEDEELELCLERGVFSEMAILECEKKDIYNVTILIKAVPCDGNYECKNDIDEKNCSLPDYFEILTLVTIILISGIFGYKLKKTTNVDLAMKNQMPTLSDLEMLHGTDALKRTMFQAQTLDNFDQIIDMEMKIHNGVLSEVVCCKKVSKQVL